MQRGSILLTVLFVVLSVGFLVAMLIWLFYHPAKTLHEKIVPTSTERLRRPVLETTPEPSEHVEFEFAETVYGSETSLVTPFVGFIPETNCGAMLRHEEPHNFQLCWFHFTETDEHASRMVLSWDQNMVVPMEERFPVGLCAGACVSHEWFALGWFDSRMTMGWISIWGRTSNTTNPWKQTAYIWYPRNVVVRLRAHKDRLLVQMQHHFVLYHVDERGVPKRMDHRYEPDSILHMVHTEGRVGLSMGDPDTGADRIRCFTFPKKLHPVPKPTLYNFQPGERASVLLGLDKEGSRAWMSTYENLLLVLHNQTLTQILPPQLPIKQLLGVGDYPFVVVLSEHGAEDEIHQGECRVLSRHGEDRYDFHDSQLLFTYEHQPHVIGPLVWFRDRYVLFSHEISSFGSMRVDHAMVVSP